MNRTRFATIAISLVISVLAFYSCKPAASSNSNLESLDLFAGAKIDRKNYCQRDPEVSYDLESVPVLAKIRLVGDIASSFDVPIQRAVSEASTSVPTVLQKFFVDNHGLILVIDNSDEICTNELRRNGGDVDGLGEINSCIVGFGANEKHDQIINIVLPPDVTNIRHNLLLMFGSYVTQFAPLLRPDLAEDLLAIQFELGRNFLKDVVEKDVFKLDSLKDYLGHNVDYKAAAASIKKLDSKGDPLTQFSFAADNQSTKGDRQIARKKFLDMVTAHSFDSYYCNNWYKYDKTILAEVKSGKKPFTALKDVKNTRDIMDVLFGNTFKSFTRFDRILAEFGKKPTKQSALSQEQILKNLSHFTPEKNGLSLAGDSSPMWAGTKAFFGSIYDNTGGAATRAYGDYSNSVAKAVNNAGPNTSIIGNVARGVGGGLSEQYNDKIYQPTYQKAEDRYNVQVQGGASRPGINTVGLAVGDVLGITQIDEAIVGVDTQSANYLSTGERVTRGIQGTGTLAGNLATVGAFSPNLAARPIFGTGAKGSSIAVNSADDVTRAAVNTTLQEARTAGTVSTSYDKWAGRTADAFGDGAKAVDIPAGTKLYRTFDGANSSARPMSQWVSREAPAISKSTPDFLGLPQNMKQPIVREFVTTKPIKAVEGSIAPIKFNQPGGGVISRPGGGQQLFVPVELQQLPNVMRASNDALLKAAGTRGATSLVPVQNSAAAVQNSANPN